MAPALINVPSKAKRGEIIEIKTLMSHIMETGYRHTPTGEVIPRDIITHFTCRYNGVEIFRADLFRLSRRTRSSHSSRQRPKAARSIFNGPATRAFRKPRPQASPSNELCPRHCRMAPVCDQSRRIMHVSATEIPQAERRSGGTFMSADTQAMQNEDTANPGMLWVLDGEGLWKVKAGTADRACADCHGDVQTSMRGVAARYPAI